MEKRGHVILYIYVCVCVCACLHIHYMARGMWKLFHLTGLAISAICYYCSRMGHTCSVTAWPAVALCTKQGPKINGLPTVVWSGRTWLVWTKAKLER